MTIIREYLRIITKLSKFNMYNFFSLLLFVLLELQHSSAGCVTVNSSTLMGEDIAFCTDYSVMCNNFTTITDVTNSLDPRFGKYYVPNMWQHYCGYHFFCGFNNKSINAVTELFNKAFNLEDSIPLDALANLPSYDISLRKCSPVHIPLIFNALKYFKGIKDFWFSFVDCNSSDINMIDLLTNDNTSTTPQRSYSRAPRLRLLNLTGNFISTLSSNLKSAKSLQCGVRSAINVLDLSYNRIAEEESLLALCCLTDILELHLKFNRIAKISTLITSCLATSLKLLNLANNEIISLEDFALNELNNLEYLDLSSNKIAIIAKTMFPDSVKGISLRGNSRLKQPDKSTLDWILPRTDIVWPLTTTTQLSTAETSQSTSTTLAMPSSTLFTENDQRLTLIGSLIGSLSLLLLFIIGLCCILYKKRFKKESGLTNNLYFVSNNYQTNQGTYRAIARDIQIKSQNEQPTEKIPPTQLKPRPYVQRETRRSTHYGSWPVREQSMCFHCSHLVRWHQRDSSVVARRTFLAPARSSCRIRECFSRPNNVQQPHYALKQSSPQFSYIGNIMYIVTSSPSDSNQSSSTELNEN